MDFSGKNDLSNLSGIKSQRKLLSMSASMVTALNHRTNQNSIEKEMYLK